MMTLWSPFNDLLRDDDFWNFGRLAGPAASPARAVQPAVDVVEEKDAFVLNAELPGVAADDVDVTVDGNVLTLKGERRYRHEQGEDDGYRRIERRYGSFQRSFTLPETVDAEGIDASMSNGVLQIRLPKRQAALPRKISIKSGGLAEKAKKLFSGDKPEEQARA